MAQIAINFTSTINFAPLTNWFEFNSLLILPASHFLEFLSQHSHISMEKFKWWAIHQKIKFTAIVSKYRILFFFFNVLSWNKNSRDSHQFKMPRTSKMFQLGTWHSIGRKYKNSRASENLFWENFYCTKKGTELGNDGNCDFFNAFFSLTLSQSTRLVSSHLVKVMLWKVEFSLNSDWLQWHRMEVVRKQHKRIKFCGLEFNDEVWQ